MATIAFGAIAGNWSDPTKWVGGVAPTAADDVTLLVTSANVTVDTTTCLCRSLDCTGYTGTLTINASSTLNVGDGSGGAIKLVAGMTVTIGSNLTSLIKLVSTSNNGGAGWGFTSAGKTIGSLTVDGVGGKWVLQDAMICGGALSVITVTNGGFFHNSKNVTAGFYASSNSNTRTVDITGSTVTLSGASGNVWNFATTTGLTFTSTGSTIVYTGAGSTNFQSGSLSYASFTRTGTAVKTDTLLITGNPTITGTLTLGGNTTQGVNRLLVQSSSVSATCTITATGGAVVISGDVDFMDITISGAPSWTNAGSKFVGDCSGNGSLITTNRTTPATQTATGTASFTWSTHGWTSRVPLPQDNVSIPNAFVAGRTVTMDMPRLGADISFTCTGTPISTATVNVSFYGSWTWATGMTRTDASDFYARGRSSHTIQSNGVVFGTYTNSSLFIIAPGGTYTLSDALAGASALMFNWGTFNTAGQNVTSGEFRTATTVPDSSGTAIRSLIMSNSTWTLTATAASTVWNTGSGVTNMTVTADGSTIVLGVVNASTRTFQGAGFTFGTLTYTVAGSTGQLTITGANTFTTINFSDASNARTLSLPTATTTTVSTFNVFGTAGKLMTVVGDVSSTQRQNKPDYLSVNNSDATGGPWYAGANSTDGGSNTGWIFGASPTPDIPGIGYPHNAMWNNRRIRSKSNREERPNNETITQPIRIR